MRAVVVTGPCGSTSEIHVKRYFDSSVGAEATGIMQEWWGQGRRGRVSLWK